MPVGENDRLVGRITDRYIAIRPVAAGEGPQVLLRDEGLDHVAKNMGDNRVPRLASI